MRRLLLLCLLVMLPFQGLWAAVVGIAEVDAPGAASRQAALHGGHDGGIGDIAMPVARHGALPDCDGSGPVEPCCNGHCSGCTTCHGPGLVALVGPPLDLGSTGSAAGVAVRCARGSPDHVPELLLRPPLPRAA